VQVTTEQELFVGQLHHMDLSDPTIAEVRASSLLPLPVHYAVDEAISGGRSFSPLCAMLRQSHQRVVRPAPVPAHHSPGRCPRWCLVSRPLCRRRCGACSS
jgi:hypothetical protein